MLSDEGARSPKRTCSYCVVEGSLVKWSGHLSVGLHVRGAVGDGRDPQAARDHGALAAPPAPAAPPLRRAARRHARTRAHRATRRPHGRPRFTYIVSTYP